MAKRKRLGPAVPPSRPEGGTLETKATNGWVGVRGRAPIADVTAGAAAQSAFEEVAAELRAARIEGRIVSQVPLEYIDEAHLVRDRVNVDPDEMATLKASLQDRGQQTPIDVVELGAGRYGLIAGWRRLMALRALYSETGDTRFSQAQVMLRSPDTAAQAYRAMVEENEVRSDLSFYERARIAVQAVRQGVFSDSKHAVQSLFSSARASKRSKISAFTVLVDVLDDRAHFPAAIPEKLGLKLVRTLQAQPGFDRALREALRKADPQTAEAERAVLERRLSGKSERVPAAPSKPVPLDQVAANVMMKTGRGGIVLSGTGVNDAFIADLRVWVQHRGT